MSNSKQLLEIFNRAISTVSDSSSLFVVNPEADFTRNRLLKFETVMKSVICMEAGSLRDELLKLNEYLVSTPTASAFVQARSKIKCDAFKAVFDIFNKRSHVSKTYKNYRLLAIDGSVLPIDNSFIDEETTILKINQFDKTFSAFHLNALYDLLECTYDDLIIQGQAKMNENDAFCQFVDRYNGRKAIFIGDRNYESFNDFEHVVCSGNKYLIRVKDIHSKTSIVKSFGQLPDSEFDRCFPSSYKEKYKLYQSTCRDI